MSGSKYLIEVALRELGVNQKQLAEMLDVSTGQISRWKNHDDYISQDLTDKITTLCKLDNLSPEFVFIVGSINNAQRWEKVIHHCVEVACDFENVGVYGSILKDFDMPLISSQIAVTLEQLGVNFSDEIPDVVEVLFKDQDLDDDQWEAFSNIPQVNVISKLIEEYVVLENFHNAYIEELSNNHDDLIDLTMDIHSCLFLLAACKIDVPLEIAPNKNAHRFEWERWYREKINELKAAAVERQIPLRSELLMLVNDDGRGMAEAVEGQAWGLNSNQIHPDIYMNEILLGLRAIHKVLPSIMQKLGIEEEYAVPTSPAKE